MSIVSVPEFQNYMSGIKLTDVQNVAAQAVLDGVQSELEVYLNRNVQERRVKEVLPITRNGMVHVSNTPIVALYGVYNVSPVSGLAETTAIALTPSAWRIGGNFIRLGYAGFGGQVSVDYRGGMNGDKIPGLKLAIMRVAAREFVHNHDDGMTVQNTEMRPPADPTPTSKGWTVEELAKFDRYRRRVAIF